MWVIVIFDDGIIIWFFCRMDCFEGREILNFYVIIELFVFFIVIVDGSNFVIVFEFFGGFFVGRFEVLIVIVLWCIEFNDLRLS